jgi:hypothetical protein
MKERVETDISYQMIIIHIKMVCKIIMICQVVFLVHRMSSTLIPLQVRGRVRKTLNQEIIGQLTHQTICLNFEIEEIG